MRLRIMALVATLTVVAASLAAATTASSALPGPPKPPPARTNVLLISTDDQRADELRFMPYTQQLIGDAGATFTDAISPYPLCCPARATLITGMFNHNNEVLTNAPPYGGYQTFSDGPYEDRSLPFWLDSDRAADDYETSFIGKYMNGYGGRDRQEVPAGWDYSAAGVVGMYDYNNRTLNVYDEEEDAKDGTLERVGELTAYPEVYQTTHNQELVEARIQHAVDNDKPFFIWQSEVAPHGGCTLSDEDTCALGRPAPHPDDQGDFAGVRNGALSDASFNERVIVEKPSVISGRSRLGPVKVDGLNGLFQARIESLKAVDRNVRDTVEMLGGIEYDDGTTALDHTLIIFTSDNGFLLGEHRATGKILGYEPSLRVPLLMRGPGVPSNVTVSDTVSLVDVAATVADAAQVEPMLTQDGSSLIPVAKGEARGWSASPIEAGYKEATAPDQWLYRGVRTKRYVYMRYEQTGEVELYDMLRDPYQLNNVAYRPTYAATRAALEEKAAVLRDCVGAACRSVSGGGVPAPTSDGTPIHPDELASSGTARQLVTVTAPGWRSRTGTLVAWRKFGPTWRVARGPLRVALGARGMIPPGRERHLRGKTPAGSFRPASALGFRANPGTDLGYRRLDVSDEWPYDPGHAATYNVFQPFRSRTARWEPTLAERFSVRRDRYPYAVVMNYNLPKRIVRSRLRMRVARDPARVRMGSFMIHTGARVGRQGWVSMPTRDVRWMLRWMRPSTEATTFVVGPTSYLRDNL